VLARVLLLLLFAPKIVSVIIRILLASGVALAVYVKGRDDCAQKHLKREIETRAEWADRVADAAGAAADRALAAERLQIENEHLSEEIADVARQEPGADDLCLSADVVDRVRQLQ
jgi:hypothetical protein